jgi:beta-lactamase regulating signal transducer with metallopeptidase domain
VDILLNSLWQGCVVTAAVWMALTLCGGLSSTTRYQVWWATLVLVLALPAIQLFGEAVPPAPEPTTGLGSLGAVVIPPLPRWPLITLVSVWLVWIGVMFFRAASAVRRVRALKQTTIPFPAAREARLGHWPAIRATGRRVRLVVSNDVRYAAAIGVCAPVIAVAPVVLQELDDEELDQVLVHEWAHIQRRDDVTRCVQLFVNMLVGFHPAVWWINRRLEIEREIACDDQVIEITGARTSYAKSLMKLAAVPNRPVDLALVSAALSAPKLTTRILRLLDTRRNVSTRWSSIALSVAIPGLLVLAMSVASLTPVISAAPELRVLVRSDQDSPPPPAAAVGATVAPTSRILGDMSHSVPESSLRRQHHARAEQLASVPVDATADGAGARTALRIEAPVLARSDDTDQRLVQSASLISRPIATNMTLPPPAPPVQVTTASAKTALETPGNVQSPWDAAATAGVTLGRTSQQAATRTAGFFTKLSKNIAGSF